MDTETRNLLGKKTTETTFRGNQKHPKKAGGFFGAPALPAAAKDEKATLLKNKVAFF